jgi:putative transcriptional regulator
VKAKRFQELLASVREAGAIERGERRPSRAFVVAPPDVRALRRGYGLTQERFARMLGISVATLRNWEQGRRRPEGSACVLLRVVARHPDAVIETVFGWISSRHSTRRISRWPVSTRSM